MREKTTKIDLSRHFSNSGILNAKCAFIALMCIGIISHILTSPPVLNPFSRGQDALLFSDFFYCVSAIEEGNPYVGESSNTIYPPLANLFYLPFSYTGDYEGMTLSEARTSIPGLSACTLYLLILTVLFFYSLMQVGAKYSFRGWPILLFLFAPEFLFGVQRANLVLLAGACINMFLVHYDSEDSNERRKGLFFLCFAVALKLWPVLLGVLILVSPHNKDNRWKEVLWCVFLTTLLLTLPFLCFTGGLRNVRPFVNGLIGWGGGTTAWSYEFGVHNFGLMLSESIYLSATMSSAIIICSKWLTYVLAALSLFLVFIDKVYWRQVMLMMLIILMVPDKVYYYYGIYLIPVAVLYLGMNDKLIWGLLYALCFAMMFVPQLVLSKYLINVGAIIMWVLLLIQSSNNVWRSYCQTSKSIV